MDDFFKSIYFHELDLQDRINNSVVVHFGFCSALIGGFYFIFEKTPAESFVFYILGGGIFFLALAACNLGLAYVGYRYHNIPPASELLKYREDLLEYYKNTSSPDPDGSSRDEFFREVDRIFSLCASKNSENNRKKKARSFFAKICMSVSLMFLFASSVSYFASDVEVAHQIHKVEVVNAKEIAVEDTKEKPQESRGRDSASVPAQTESPPLKPVPPKPIVSMEHRVPVVDSEWSDSKKD